MGKVVGAVADRLINLMVPRATAGACACNDCYQTDNCSGAGCPMGTAPYYCTNCDCSVTRLVGCNIRQRCL
jgi:hypothetical protein